MKIKKYIKKAKRKAYQESHHDCVMFIAGWVDNQIETKFTEELKDSYKSTLEGLRTHASKGLSLAIESKLESVGLYPSNTLLKGAVCIMDNGYPSIYDGESCVAPLPAMAGIAMINPRNIAKFYNIP